MKKQVIIFIPMARKPHGFLSLGMNGHHLNEHSKLQFAKRDTFCHT